MKKDPRARIPSSDLTAYERWELPLLDERGNEVWIREEEMDLKPLTAEDLQNIRREALEDGTREGREAGHREGFEQGRNEGLKAGHTEGFQQGEKAGIEAGRAGSKAEVEAGLGRLQTLMAEMLDPMERQTENLETALLNLTLSLARAVIHRELQLDSKQIREVLKEAVAMLPNQEEAIRIYVNPADTEWVKDVASRFEADSRVVEDDSIVAGGCRVENRNSLVDFTIEKRFQKAVQAMLDRQLQGGEKADQGELGAVMGEMTDFHRDVLESAPESEAPAAAGSSPDSNGAEPENPNPAEDPGEAPHEGAADAEPDEEADPEPPH